MNEAPKVPGNNSLPQGTTPNIGTNPSGGVPSKTQAISQGLNALDNITGDNKGPQIGDQIIDPNEKNNLPAEDGIESGTPGEVGPQVGDKVAPGYEIGEDGKVKQSATSKLQGAVARGVTAYFTGGNVDAANAAGQASNSGIGRRLSDQLEKNKAVEKAAEELEEVADAVNNATDAVAKAKSGDVSVAIESAKEVKTDLKKAKKKHFKKVVILALIGCAPMIIALFSIMMVVAAFGDEHSSSNEQIYKNSYDYKWPDVEDDSTGNDEAGGQNGGGDEPISNAEVEKIIAEIPGWDSLSSGRKAVIRAALSAVGLKYLYGGKPTGPGLSGIPSSGIDCSGFVDWAYWTATGNDPKFGGTYDMVSNQSTWFENVSYEEMKPGDIVVRRSGGGGHTAIYLGNNKYVHAKGAKYGIVVSGNSNHAYYQYKFRFRGI